MLPAIVGALVSGLIAWIIAKSGAAHKVGLLEADLVEKLAKVKSAQSDLTAAQQEISRLKPFEERYNTVKRNLEASSVVREYLQPVLLIGPRFVGKTSLLEQWRAPWDHARLAATQTHSTSVVPVYDFKLSNVEPHFADDSILTDVTVHLKLRVHDFPGELGSQEKIVEQAIGETVSLREQTRRDLGVVLICMFDAEEAAENLSPTTLQYYNAELFSKLRHLVSHSEIRIERLILVFNKYDLLQRHYPNENDIMLLSRCLSMYNDLLTMLKGVCNQERVCEVFTIVDRDNMVSNNRGAPIVLGEAARRFVQAMAGAQVAQSIVPAGATRHAASLF